MMERVPIVVCLQYAVLVYRDQLPAMGAKWEREWVLHYALRLLLHHHRETQPQDTKPTVVRTPKLHTPDTSRRPRRTTECCTQNPECDTSALSPMW